MTHPILGINFNMLLIASPQYARPECSDNFLGSGYV